MVDIHNFEKQYIRAEQYLRESNISDRNRELIFGYRDACFLHQVCGKVRLVRAFDVLGRCARLLAKDYDTVTRQDLEVLITALMRKNRKPATIATYKAILKRFLGWVHCPQEFPHLTIQPPVIAWMTVHLKKRDEKVLQRTDMLTPDDMERLLQVCHNTRDKAFLATLWETGCRVSELGNLEVRHATKHEHGYILDALGKTGGRSPLIVSSAPHLATWLSHHPFRDNPRSPLWVHYQYRKSPKAVHYSTLRSLLKRIFTRAKIDKPYNPHIFRHSRATFVLANGIMTDSQARQYFGWSHQSNMIGKYSHLVDADAHNALLKENNLAPRPASASQSAVRSCERCKTLNASTAPHCVTCTAPLDLAAAYESAQQQQDTDRMVLQLAKVLVEQGLLDQAATAVHEANLGAMLARLSAKERARPTALLSSDG